MAVTKAIDHEVRIHAASIIKQIILTLSNPMSIVREALSNACASEVRATKVIVTHFFDKDYGYSWTFDDDGCGMPYSEQDDTQRLNRFLNVGFGASAGFKSDQYGEKGLGSKLCYASKKLIIETYPENCEDWYRVEVDDSYGYISSKTPKIPEPDIFISKNKTGKKGTKINVLGYMGGAKEYRCTFAKIKNYLISSTIAGTTSEVVKEMLPRIILRSSIDGGLTEEQIDTGYPFLKQKKELEGKLVIIDPISISKRTSGGETVSITLKGGYFLLSISGRTEHQASTGGLRLSFNSIPYISLYLSQYKGDCELMNNGKDTVLVVECNDIELDMGREDFIWNAKAEAFTEALREAFKNISESKEYKDWKKLKIKEKKREASFSLNERIDELKGPGTKWVYYDNKLIHKKPESENDTLALLWKLEGMNAIPMHYFRTLEHTEQSGIDVIAEYQWDDISAKKSFSPIEIEYELENFLKHDHEINQAPLIVCWGIQNKEKLIRQSLLHKTDFPFKFKFMDSEVLALSRIPQIAVREKK